MDAPRRAFISYARSDGEAFASNLRLRLQTDHPTLTLWQDRAELEGGVGWWKQIAEAIDQVDILIMVMTPAVTQSAVAQKEWRYARQQGVRVCPVLGVPPICIRLQPAPELDAQGALLRPRQGVGNVRRLLDATRERKAACRSWRRICGRISSLGRESIRRWPRCSWIGLG